MKHCSCAIVCESEKQRRTGDRKDVDGLRVVSFRWVPVCFMVVLGTCGFMQFVICKAV